MQSQVYEGKSSAMRVNTCWLASEDIIDAGDVKVTIEAVFKNLNAEFDQGRKEKVCFSLKFKGADKQMIVNNTNRKILVAMFGTDTKKWRGQQITLYVTEVKAFGGMRPGIRIRLDGIRKPQVSTDPHEAAAAAIESHGASEVQADPDELTDEDRAAIAAEEAKQKKG